ncbi:hypothetical protein M9H77_14618 [Catharanthus roseus]|uniref:Uncharacterized protein n=1 Tax=Catharanthus roseus TaxID=4058 RepID=A0ACC0BNJ5_CATRO|nr:hypothetical protein M9H77_14618 [Catharanthus roseus]
MPPGSGGAAKVPSLPPPRPKSPPEYPDLYGKRRELARVQLIEREIGFLEVDTRDYDVSLLYEPLGAKCEEEKALLPEHLELRGFINLVAFGNGSASHGFAVTAGVVILLVLRCQTAASVKRSNVLRAASSVVQNHQSVVVTVAHHVLKKIQNAVRCHHADAAAVA